MDYRAEYVGWYAGKLLSRNRARVRHVFSNTVYLDVEGDLMVITRKTLKAPMNIGVGVGPPFYQVVKPGEAVSLSSKSIGGRRIRIDLDGVEMYEDMPRELKPDLKQVADKLLRGAFMLSLLYQVSGNNPMLFSTPFKAFLEDVVKPLASRMRIRRSALQGLLGYGEGFTPSGDDILTGFLPTLRYLSGPEIMIPENVLLSSTTWASGMLLKYAQEGLLDEGLTGFLKSIQIGDGELMLDNLLAIARRGHTSGLEIATGAILAASIIHERIHRQGVLRKILGKLIS